jgi:hypothetical protein
MENEFSDVAGQIRSGKEKFELLPASAIALQLDGGVQDWH